MTNLTYAFLTAILAYLAYQIWTLTTLERTVMSLQETVDQLTEKLAVAYGEIVAEIAELKAQVEAAGVAEQVDFTALQKAADALDNLVPDEQVEPKVEPIKRDDTDDK